MFFFLGYGIGSFLGGLFRSVLPILKRGGLAVGKEIFNAGSNFINDVENNIKPMDALNARARETLGNLKRKAMFGEGFKTGRYRRKRQLSTSSQGVKTKRRKVEKKPKKKNNKPKSKKKKTVTKRRKQDIDIFA